MPQERPVGDPPRTRTCACGQTVDLFDGSHRIEGCPACEELLTQREWEALAEYVRTQETYLKDTVTPNDVPWAHAVEEDQLISFHDPNEDCRIYNPFMDICEDDVNPVTYYGELFTKSPFVTLARILARLTAEAYAHGELVGTRTANDEQT